MAGGGPVGGVPDGKGRYPGLPIGAPFAPGLGGKVGGRGGGSGDRPWSVDGYELWDKDSRRRPAGPSPGGSDPGIDDWNKTWNSPQNSYGSGAEPNRARGDDATVEALRKEVEELREQNRRYKEEEEGERRGFNRRGEGKKVQLE